MASTKRREPDDTSHVNSENSSKKVKHSSQSTNREYTASSEPPQPPNTILAGQGQDVSPHPPSEASLESQPNTQASATKTFQDLGIIESLCEACTALGYKTPTPIQTESIPLALEGRDIIGLAETGSGKTAAFALPILQALMEKPQSLFALIMAPTRELAYQISQAFEALGSLISVRVAVLVGGLDMVSQAIALGKKPHIVVATPGRLLDHLENTRGFSLRALKYLVMDEADRLLDLDFGAIIDKILKVLPQERYVHRLPHSPVLARPRSGIGIIFEGARCFHPFEIIFSQHFFHHREMKDADSTHAADAHSCIQPQSPQKLNPSKEPPYPTLYGCQSRQVNTKQSQAFYNPTSSSPTSGKTNTSSP